VLNNVNIDPAPKRFVQPFPRRPFDNLLNRKVWRVGTFAMQQSSSNPNFVRNLQSSLGSCICHDHSSVFQYYHVMM
jgi:hypothetical protein